MPLISKYITPILWFMTVFGWSAAILTSYAYMEKRDEVIEEREACNSRAVMAVAEAERITRKVSEANAAILLEELASKYERERAARELAENISQEAEQKSEDQLEVIEQLMAEASIDEIPDSKECLNVFVPEPAVSRLRLRPRSCPGAVPGSGTGASPLCSGSTGAFGNDFPTEDFSDITYGDAIKLWTIDRESIRKLNGQLTAIGMLDKNK